MKTKLTFALLLPLLLAAAPATEPATQPVAKTDTPENALRSFFHAMALHDAKLGAAVTLPVDGSDILYNDKNTPAQTAQLLQWADNVPIKTFARGDSITVPTANHTTRTIILDPNFINENRAQLLPQNLPFPFAIERQPDNTWRVNTTPIIAARKAAERARQRLSASQAASQPSTQPASQP